jgi:hypothetical protein
LRHVIRKTPAQQLGHGRVGANRGRGLRSVLPRVLARNRRDAH